MNYTSKTLKFIRNFELSKQISLMIAIAFIFSVVCRLYWINWANNYPYFMFNSQLMINTNDGYSFAEGARDLIAGFHQENDLSYVWNPLSKITAFLAQILPFKFETIILYMSVFFASLVVVPLVLIGYELGASRAGLIAALIGSIANSYYNRTMAGYYDTDMLNIVLPMFVLWAMIRLCAKNDKNCLFYLPLSMLTYSWWYSSSFSLNFMMIIMFGLYVFVFKRREILCYEALILMLLSLSNFDIYAKLCAVIFLAFIFVYKSQILGVKGVVLIGVAVLLFFAFMGGLTPIFFQVKFYFFRSLSDAPSDVFHYYNVNQTIRESSYLIDDLGLFMDRISSHKVVFFISLAGVILACYKRKEFLLSLPILGLGILALKSGLRFTIYSVPIMALGFGYFVNFVVNWLNIIKIAQRFLLFLITCAALYPSLKHIQIYTTQSVLYQSEVQILDNLKRIASREDYVLSWWDYGYPIRYYSDVKTLIDGGKHLGNHNFPVSYALFMDQTSSANMARLAVEYTENKEKNSGDFLKNVMKDYKISDVSELFSQLESKKFKLPNKTREIYYFLPDRMLSIMPVISYFSNLDLKDGKAYSDGFFRDTHYAYTSENGGFVFESGMVLSRDLSSIYIHDSWHNVNSYIETDHNLDGTLKKTIVNLDANANFYVVYMHDYGRFLIMDKKMFNSTAIQLFVMEEYDKELFEPVIIRPEAKIYRLKR